MSQQQRKVQIGGDTGDVFARYVRPCLIIKHEGSGNGVKTVLVNLVDVAEHLHVPVDYPLKFLGMSLGVNSKKETTKTKKKASNKRFEAKFDRYVLSGTHTIETLESWLQQFEQQFVCCPKCRAPEIRLLVGKKSKMVQYDCAACGQHAPLDSTHKFVTYVVTHPPPLLVKSETAGVPSIIALDSLVDHGNGKDMKSVEKTYQQQQQNQKDNAVTEWSTDTSEEAQRIRQAEEFKIQRVPPTEPVLSHDQLLWNTLVLDRSISDEDLAKLLTDDSEVMRLLQRVYQRDCPGLWYELVFRVLLSNPKIKSWIPLLSQYKWMFDDKNTTGTTAARGYLPSADRRRCLLQQLDNALARKMKAAQSIRHSQLGRAFADLVMFFYDSELIYEKDIRHLQCSTPFLSTCLSPIIQWLDTADEEE